MSEQQQLSVEDAMERLEVIPDYDPGRGPAPCVHTLAEAGVAMLGAHWYLTDVRETFERCGVEEAGPMATAMGHGLVVIDGNRTLFFATTQTENEAA